MIVSKNSKISDIIKFDERAIDVIASINSNFKRLKNPILRKLLAPRVTVAQAAKIGNTTPDVILRKLQSLKFQVDFSSEKADTAPANINKEDFISGRTLVELDVREILRNGKDPLGAILERIKSVDENHVLKLITPFEPVPLLQILSRKGYEYFVETIAPETVETYFRRKEKVVTDFSQEIYSGHSKEFHQIKKQFENKFKIIDVRNMEMPDPMVTILRELSTLPHEMALFIHHKKEPVFLLPELDQSGFKYVLERINDHYIQMIIFK